jgi:hypothetical protein
LVEKPERDHLEDLGADGRAVLSESFKNACEEVDFVWLGTGTGVVLRA